MKITHVETYPLRIPFKPERIMYSTLGEQRYSYYVIVRLGTEGGVEGVGEVTVVPAWSGETVRGAQVVIEEIFAPLVVGCDPHDTPEIERRMDTVCKHNWFAKAAIEMACWDIRGKAAGRPVYELLGGAQRSLTVRSRFSMGAYETDRARSRAAELIAEGFRTIKVKVGGEAARDVERVRAVREVIGADIDMVIDANCGWNVDTAIDAIRQLDDCNLDLVEQPTPDGDYEGMARVRRETTPKVMADDICFDKIDARELIRNECCDVISVYPGKNGGIRKALEISELATEHGLASTIGSNLETDVATAAMGHLVVAARSLDVERFPGDMLGPDYHELSIAKEPLEITGPLTSITDRPGLGVDVDWGVVRANPL